MPEINKKTAPEAEEQSMDTVDIDIDSPEQIAALFAECDTARKEASEAAVPAETIREKFIKPLFAAGRDRIPVGTLVRTIDRAYKLEGDNKIQNSSVRSAAGAHRVGTVDGVAYIFPHPVDKDGRKLTDAEIKAIEARKKAKAPAKEDVDALLKDVV